jgi:DNA-binding transcriptional MerR regulator
LAELLRFSLNDIRASLEKKKKSRALKNFEIQLRRASLDVQSYKIKAPIEQQDQIDDWLSQAESIRTQFMGMLFPQ